MLISSYCKDGNCRFGITFDTEKKIYQRWEVLPSKVATTAYLPKSNRFSVALETFRVPGDMKFLQDDKIDVQCNIETLKKIGFHEKTMNLNFKKERRNSL